MYIVCLFTLLSSVIAAPLTVARAEDAITGKWIVKLKGEVATLGENDLKASISSQPDHRYAIPGFRGFSSTLTNEELGRLQASEQVTISTPNYSRNLLTPTGRLYRTGRQSSGIDNGPTIQHLLGLVSYFSQQALRNDVSFR